MNSKFQENSQNPQPPQQQQNSRLQFDSNSEAPPPYQHQNYPQYQPVQQQGAYFVQSQYQPVQQQGSYIVQQHQMVNQQALHNNEATLVEGKFNLDYLKKGSAITRIILAVSTKTFGQIN
jgi:hypothetical protein